MDLSPYVARLALALPAVCALVVAGLWAAKRFLGPSLGAGTGSALRLRLAIASRGPRDRRPSREAPPPARVTQTIFLGVGARLAVVEFADRRLLLAVGRGQVTTLSDTAASASALACTAPRAFEIVREVADAR